MARRSSVIALLAVVGVVMVGCGDPTTAPGAVPATEAPVTAPPVSEAPAFTDDVVVDATTPDTFTVEPGVTPTTTQPLGGVTIDDPMPPQVDAATDPAAADVGVRFAYQHWILIGLDPAVRARLVENGEASTEGLERGITEARGLIEFGRLVVDEVRFTGVDSADVVFRATWYDQPSAYFPDPMTGTAIFHDGSWRISTHSLCLLAFVIGQDCAGASNTLPVSPAGFAVPVPDDLQWIGDPATPDLVAVPGSSMWANDPAQVVTDAIPDGYRALTLTTDVLVGSSGLSDDDATFVLSSGRFGLVDGQDVEVDGGRARALAGDGYVQLVVLRDDDVLLSAYAQGVSLDEVLAVVGGLTPTQLPDGFATQVELG